MGSNQAKSNNTNTGIQTNNNNNTAITIDNNNNNNNQINNNNSPSNRPSSNQGIPSQTRTTQITVQPAKSTNIIVPNSDTTTTNNTNKTAGSGSTATSGSLANSNNQQRNGYGTMAEGSSSAAATAAAGTTTAAMAASTQSVRARATTSKSGTQRRLGDRWYRHKQGVIEYEKSEKGTDAAWSHNSNKVTTSKYSLLTFLPLNLWEQFQNLANIYFLFIGIFQIIPQVTTTNGNPTMYQPLAFIVFVSAVRAAKEDWDKHKADAKRNSYPYTVVRPTGLQSIEAGDIRVGDIVKVQQNDMVPADMLFLGSALPKGHCFIDKSNLNGETTLEVMNSIPMTRPLCNSDITVRKFSAALTYEPPNKRFDSFRGTMIIECLDYRPEITIDGKALIMRETNLRNCEYIYGLVIYTGNDTKIQRSNLDGEKPKIKVSRIMREVNKLLRWMCILQLLLCIAGGIIAGSYRGYISITGAWYLVEERGHNFYPAALTGFLAFFSWFILLSQMVPISLIVSSELVKFAQSVFIQWDINIYHEGIDKPTKCNSSSIHEDLGLIDYVFSDKTGTLTQNKMEFRYISSTIGEFGSKETDIAKSVKTRQAELESKSSGQVNNKKIITWTQLTKPYLPKAVTATSNQSQQKCCTSFPWFAKTCWNAPMDANADEDEFIPAAANIFTEEERLELKKALWGAPLPTETPQQNARKRFELKRYLTHMALSNTVKPYDDGGILKFQAESAEELAMVQFARSVGFLKKQINPTILEITEYSEDLKSSKTSTETYNHVATLGFTSKRARVTVIYQKQDPEKSILIMSKGQDTVVLPLLNDEMASNNDLLLNLKDMSTNGLRTLVCAHSLQSNEWWNKYSQLYADMIARDSTAASEGHPEKCIKAQCEKCAAHELFEQMELSAKLQYLGCIGLEDQLQNLVPETIADCLKAGIKVWMITGDKLETAKNIGLACNLIDPDMSPQLKNSESIDEIVTEYQNSRLLEITGQWANLAENKELMGNLFNNFDQDGNGYLALNELQFILKSLRCSIPEAKLTELLGGEKTITKARFIEIMQTTRLTKYEAVKYDIEQAIETYNRIENHELFPVSILIDRAAFQVMFPHAPGKTPPKPAAAAAAAIDTVNRPSTIDQKDKSEPTEAELESLRSKFFKLADRSKSLVFARAEPAMKKRMVTEIQARVPGAITLAIGDGANDTDMITAAHIGVGIAGVEGTAATNSADYAIGTFRFLHTLLFVHGFLSYQRISKLVNFIFYKASLCALTMYIFGFFSAFSGQQFFNDPPYQLYNVMYTALPILFTAVLDQPISMNTLQEQPLLYKKSKHTAFNTSIFAGWIWRSALHTILIYFICYAQLGVNDINNLNGKTEGIWYFATVVYYCCVLVPTFIIIFEMNTITFLHWMAIFLSVLGLYIVTLIINYLLKINPDLFGVVVEIYESASAWLIIILAVSVCLLFECAYRAYQRESNPELWQIFQERNRFIKSNPGRIGDDYAKTAIVQPIASKVHLPIHDDPTSSKRNSVNGVITDETKYSHLRMNMVRAMLRFRNMTGGQFDSAAQAHLQHHDQYTDSQGKLHQAINTTTNNDENNTNIINSDYNDNDGTGDSIRVQPPLSPNPASAASGSSAALLPQSQQDSSTYSPGIMLNERKTNSSAGSAGGSAGLIGHVFLPDNDEVKTIDRR